MMTTISGANFNAINNNMDLQGMDLETAMMAVQAKRAQNLEAQMNGQLETVKAQNNKMSKLNELMTAINKAITTFPAKAATDAKLNSATDGGVSSSVADKNASVSYAYQSAPSANATKFSDQEAFKLIESSFGKKMDLYDNSTSVLGDRMGPIQIKHANVHVTRINEKIDKDVAAAKSDYLKKSESEKQAFYSNMQSLDPAKCSPADKERALKEIENSFGQPKSHRTNNGVAVHNHMTSDAQWKLNKHVDAFNNERQASINAAKADFISKFDAAQTALAALPPVAEVTKDPIQQTSSATKGGQSLSNDFQAAANSIADAPTDTSIMGQIEHAANQAGFNIDLKGGDIKKGELEAVVAEIKSKIDSASNNQQMDMIRLQSLSGKRNEAFETMTNFIKKMQDSRSSIISNMR